MDRSLSNQYDNTTKFSIFDYIDRIIPTNGFISNDNDTDMQFWTGYRIFIRDELDSYDSISEWQEDTGGFTDRSRYNGYGATTEYVYQQFSRGSSCIIDAGLRNWNIGLVSNNQLLSPISRSIEEIGLIDVLKYDYMWMSAAVNMHRKRIGSYVIPYNEDEHILISALIDETSKTALLEKQRVQINLLEAGDRL